MSPIPTVTIDHKSVSGDAYHFAGRVKGPKSYLSVASGGTFLKPADFGFNKLEFVQMTGVIGPTSAIGQFSFDYQTGAWILYTAANVELADAVDASAIFFTFVGRAKE